jgi:hypothetical protein
VYLKETEGEILTNYSYKRKKHTNAEMREVKE